MKAIENPKQENYGWCLLTYPTEEFRDLLNEATEKISPYNETYASYHTVYYKTKHGELSEFDTCDNSKCIEAAKKEIRKIYGKGTHVKENWYGNDSDHEEIQICSQCDRPLNEWLTWCESELEYLEQHRPLSREFLTQEAFLINSILQSSPTCDDELNRHFNFSNKYPAKDELQSREEFHQRVVQLCEAVMTTL